MEVFRLEVGTLDEVVGRQRDVALALEILLRRHRQGERTGSAGQDRVVQSEPGLGQVVTDGEQRKHAVLHGIGTAQRALLAALTAQHQARREHQREQANDHADHQFDQRKAALAPCTVNGFIGKPLCGN